MMGFLKNIIRLVNPKKSTCLEEEKDSRSFRDHKFEGLILKTLDFLKKRALANGVELEFFFSGENREEGILLHRQLRKAQNVTELHLYEREAVHWITGKKYFEETNKEDLQNWVIQMYSQAETFNFEFIGWGFRS